MRMSRGDSHLYTCGLRHEAQQAERASCSGGFGLPTSCMCAPWTFQRPQVPSECLGLGPRMKLFVIMLAAEDWVSCIMSNH